MRIFAILLAGLLCTAPVQAEIVTYNYTGVFDEMAILSFNPYDTISREVESSNVFPGGINIGNTFKGTFSYDTQAELHEAPSHLFSYGYIGWSDPTNQASYSSFTLIDSNTTFASTNATNGIAFLRWITTEFSVSNAIGPLSVHFKFYNESMPAILVPPTTLDLATLQNSAHAVYMINDQESLWIGGHLTSIERISPVPEPGTYAMFIAGLAMMGAVARKRRHRSIP